MSKGIQASGLYGERLDLYSANENISLLALMSEWEGTTRALKSIPYELLEKSEFELVRNPDDVQRRLKISFWNEYRRVQRLKVQSPTMGLSKVLFGVCSQSYWRNQVCARPEVLAWVVSPPTEEVLVWQELLELGNKKIRKALKLPLVEKRYWKDKSGELHVERRTNVSLIKEVRSIVEMLQNRLHGSIVQKAELKSLNVNVSGDSPKAPSDDMRDIDAMLKRIEHVAKGLPEIPEVIVEGIIPEDKHE